MQILRKHLDSYLKKTKIFNFCHFFNLKYDYGFAEYSHSCDHISFKIPSVFSFEDFTRFSNYLVFFVLLTCFVVFFCNSIIKTVN